MSPRPNCAACRITDARFVLRISGSVNSDFSSYSSSEYSLITTPGLVLPARPALWFALALEIASIGSL